jgi:hypothetical protein
MNFIEVVYFIFLTTPFFVIPDGQTDRQIDEQMNGQTKR